MDRRSEIDARRMERHSLVGGLSIFALTSIHHVYGAILYDTPWRHHVVAVGAIAAAAMIGGFAIARGRPDELTGRLAWWVGWAVNAAVFVLLVGLYEGLYNHALKTALYYGGLSIVHLRVLFPAPTYELPNDAIFEITGILQVIPALVTGRALWKLAGRRLRLSRPARAGLGRRVRVDPGSP